MVPDDTFLVNILNSLSRLLLAASTALTAQTGSLVSPTRKVMSQSSGRWARKPRSLHSPDSS